MKYRSVTVKLEEENFHHLKKICELSNNGEVSSFIRKAVLEKMNQGAVSNVAGKNKIDYNPSKDNFSWKIELDDGREQVILDNISGEFIENLFDEIKLQFKKREDVLKMKNKQSVAVPKRLVK